MKTHSLRVFWLLGLAWIFVPEIIRAAESAEVAQAKHWAFAKPKRPELPRVQDKRWPRNPVDYFILAKLEEKKLTPSPETDRVTLLRRLKFDLLGLPPSPAEMKEFLRDKKPGAYERVVEQF